MNDRALWGAGRRMLRMCKNLGVPPSAMPLAHSKIHTFIVSSLIQVTLLSACVAQPLISPQINSGVPLI